MERSLTPPFGLRIGQFDHKWLVGLSILSVQIGAGFAGRLMESIGPAAVVLFRQGGAALVLLAVCRPAVRGRTAAEWRTISVFGIVLALMNVTFYAAVDRLPLGLAVTIELTGPLLLAATLSRRVVDLMWVLCAGFGVALLGGGGGHVDRVGVVLALLAACGWATYILLSRSAGRHSSGLGSLGLAMAIAALLVAPFGVRAGTELVTVHSLAVGALVAVLAALVPFSLEFVALRHVPTRVFGVLMSLSPVAAALSGYVVLHQKLSVREVVAMALVMTASAGTVRTARGSAADAVAVS